MRDTVLAATKDPKTLIDHIAINSFAPIAATKKIEGFVFIVFALDCLYTSGPLYGEVSK